MHNSKKPPATSRDLEPEYVPFTGLRLESTCGEIDQSQNVEQYNGKLGVAKLFVTKHQSPVGQIQWNAKLSKLYKNPGNIEDLRIGTGTLISENLFLTAGHLFDSKDNPLGWQTPKRDGTNEFISPQESAKNMHVNFNYQYDGSGGFDKKRVQQFPILELLEYRLDGYDYAIVRLDDKPGKKFGIATISKVEAKKNDPICIIGHPEGYPKRIASGLCSDLSQTKIGYNNLDTLTGVSGASILSSDGTIVGVHTTGGCDSIGYNSGYRISVLIKVSPVLQQIVSSI